MGSVFSANFDMAWDQDPPTSSWISPWAPRLNASDSDILQKKKKTSTYIYVNLVFFCYYLPRLNASVSHILQSKKKQKKTSTCKHTYKPMHEHETVGKEWNERIKNEHKYIHTHKRRKRRVRVRVRVRGGVQQNNGTDTDKQIDAKVNVEHELPCVLKGLVVPHSIWMRYIRVWVCCLLSVVSLSVSIYLSLVLSFDVCVEGFMCTAY